MLGGTVCVGPTDIVVEIAGTGEGGVTGFFPSCEVSIVDCTIFWVVRADGKGDGVLVGAFGVAAFLGVVVWEMELLFGEVSLPVGLAMAVCGWVM